MLWVIISNTLARASNEYHSMGEIRKISTILGCKKCVIWSYVSVMICSIMKSGGVYNLFKWVLYRNWLIASVNENRRCNQT